jgi:hypothetical protein
MIPKKYILIIKASLRLSLLLISFNAFAFPENLTSLIITAESKIDICCATLNSKIDQVSAPIQADFDGTFTALATILAAEQSALLSTNTLIHQAAQEESTVQSKLDTCCYALSSKLDVLLIDAISTQTVVGSIYAQETTIESKLDSCCSLLDCNPRPLILNPSGNGIFQPGHYCVVNDVTFDLGASIIIFSDNVVLDLNNHIITGSNFFPTIVTQVNDQVTIKNGTLINGTNGVGLNLVGGKNIHIQNIDVTGGDTGILATGNSNVHVKNVTCRGYGMHGFRFQQPVHCSFENCKAYNGLAGTSGFTVQGFVTTTESSASLINCLSNNNQIGFNIIDVQNAYLNSCSAYNNSLQGIQLHTTTSLAENAILLDCITERCQFNGFNILIDPLITASLNIVMKGCQANRNGNGFQIFDNIGGLKGVITDCIANRNSNIGFSTINFPNTIGNCAVTHCIASCNFEGFNSTRLGFSYYNNEASDNTFRNFTITSADSADVKLFYDPLNGRGDNLASKLP